MEVAQAIGVHSAVDANAADQLHRRKRRAHLFFRRTIAMAIPDVYTLVYTHVGTHV